MNTAQLTAAEKLAQLRARELVAGQRTPAWLEARMSLITASEAASFIRKTQATCDAYNKQMLPLALRAYELYGGKEPRPLVPNPDVSCDFRGTRLMSLAARSKSQPQPPDERMEFACNWGTRFENVARRLYQGNQLLHLVEREEPGPEQRFHEFGLVRHAEHSFLGASPDGVIENGDELRLVEFKCPSGAREVGVPSLYYWIQMQLQLSCTGARTCDFVDVKFAELEKEEFHEAGDEKLTGAMVRLSDTEVELPPEELRWDPIEQEAWCLETIRQDGKGVVQRWGLQDYLVMQVEADDEWVHEMVPELEKGLMLVETAKVLKEHCCC